MADEKKKRQQAARRETDKQINKSNKSRNPKTAAKGGKPADRDTARGFGTLGKLINPKKDD